MRGRVDLTLVLLFLSVLVVDILAAVVGLVMQ